MNNIISPKFELPIASNYTIALEGIGGGWEELRFQPPSGKTR
jgi:hypothetical protein